MKWQLILISIIILVYGCGQKSTESVIRSSTAVEDSMYHNNSYFNSIETDCLFVSPVLLGILDRDGRGFFLDSSNYVLQYSSMDDLFLMAGAACPKSLSRSARTSVNSRQQSIKPIPVLIRKKYSKKDSTTNISSSTSADYKSTEVSEVRVTGNKGRWWIGAIVAFVVIICLFVDFFWWSRK